MYENRPTERWKISNFKCNWNTTRISQPYPVTNVKDSVLPCPWVMRTKLASLLDPPKTLGKKKFFKVLCLDPCIKITWDVKTQIPISQTLWKGNLQIWISNQEIFSHSNSEVEDHWIRIWDKFYFFVFKCYLSITSFTSIWLYSGKHFGNFKIQMSIKDQSGDVELEI